MHAINGIVVPGPRFSGTAGIHGHWPMMGRIGLRNKNRNRNKSIASAVGIALLIHGIAWFYWEPIQKVTAPQIPDWVNITLVAGFEEQPINKPSQVKPVTPPRPEPVPVKPPEKKPITKPRQDVAPINPVEDKSPQRDVEDDKPAAASTFIEADSRPFALDNPKPVYPSFARRRGMQGVVVLQVNVSKQGTVTAIHVMRSSGYRLLDVAALNSVKHWRFMPARKGDQSVASSVQVPVRFILNNP
ncbi:MAG: energy transducer TonB [Thioalkalispiraceae bacterium]|jgi:protein TonB